MAIIENPVTIVQQGGGGQDIGIPREITQNGVYQMPSSLTTYTLPQGATDLGDYCLYSAFTYSSTITSVDFSGLTSLSGTSGAGYAFRYCKAITSVDISRLTTISGETAMSSMLSNCTALSSVDLGNLVTISGAQGMNAFFSACSSLTSVGGSSASVDLTNLTTISGAAGMQNCFLSCTGLVTATFPSLAELTETSGSALKSAFRNCTNLTTVSFPALSTFGNTYVGIGYFNNMLQGCSDVTVHFPSSLQNRISSWNDVRNGFGGTNTTVLFDL